MALSKAEVYRLVRAYFSDHFNRPLHEITHGLSLRDDFGYDDASLSDLARIFNQMKWVIDADVVVTESEMRGCDTVGSVADLIFGKQ